MTSMFGPNGQQVLALIACITGLSADQVDQVTGAWKRGSARGRARAWAHLNRAAPGDERYRILAAASLARREALGTAERMHRKDWAFWAAACDAGAAVAAGAQIGCHYDTLFAPFAQVVPALARHPAATPGSAAASAGYTQAEPVIPAKKERLGPNTDRTSGSALIMRPAASAAQLR